MVRKVMVGNRAGSRQTGAGSDGRKSYTGFERGARKSSDGATHQAAFGAAGITGAARGAAACFPAEPDLRTANCGGAGDCVDAVPYKPRLDLPHRLVAMTAARRGAAVLRARRTPLRAVLREINLGEKTANRWL